ncbi:MAG: hypothetical protein ABSD82_03415 [Solirubrobacteraceae bacterium]|jgi:hypothetical protein
MTWTFIWLMLLLKIPIAGILWIVWWAIHQNDDEPVADSGDGGGGSKLRLNHHHRRPRPHLPRHPRRGPHAGAPPPAPARVRTVVALARRVEH